MGSLIMLKRSFIFLSSFFFALAVCSSAYSATYYVDYLSGDDSNNGLSTSTPWKHCPGDKDASGSANITLAAGDTVVFKGGVIYAFDGVGNDNIVANASGESSNRITYISGHVHASLWGSGRAKFDCTNADVASAGQNGVLYLSNYRYITVQGIEMYNMTDTATDTTGFIGWKDGNTSTDAQLIIDNVLLYNTNDSCVVIRGRYTAGNRASNVIIKNSTMYDSYYLNVKWN